MKAANGVGDAIQLTNTKLPKILFNWSPDGRYLIFTQTNPNTKTDAYLLQVSEKPDTVNNKPKVIINSEFNEFSGSISPDGKWLLYVSDESGQFQLYVRPFPGTGSKWQISTANPAIGYFGWSVNGKEIYYRSASNKVMSVEVAQHGSEFEVGRATPLFDLPFSGQGIFDGVSKDNKHFLFRIPVQSTDIPPLTLVTNWDKKLKQRSE